MERNCHVFLRLLLVRFVRLWWCAVVLWIRRACGGLREIATAGLYLHCLELPSSYVKLALILTAKKNHQFSA